MHIERPASIRALRPRRRSAGDKLLEALQALARGKGRIAHHAERSWASVTFAGTRHLVDIVFEGGEAIEAGECFIAFLPEHEFAIPGQLVADAAITAVDHRLEPARLSVTCDLLLLEES